MILNVRIYDNIFWFTGKSRQTIWRGLLERDANEPDGKRCGCYYCSLLELRFEGMEIRMEYQALYDCVCGKYKYRIYMSCSVKLIEGHMQTIPFI